MDFMLWLKKGKIKSKMKNGKVFKMKIKKKVENLYQSC